MKIGILLLNNDPNYRGGVNSYIEGLLEGIKKVDKENDYYFLIYKKNEKFYKKHKSKNFHIKSFDDEKNWLVKSQILRVLTAPILRKIYPLVEYVLYFKLIKNINELKIDILYSPSAPYFPLLLKGKKIVSPHDIQYLHYPQNFSLIDRWYRYTTFPPMMKVSTVVQASTEFMKKDFKKMMGVPFKKIEVIPEGVMKDFLNFKESKLKSKKFLKKYALETGYLFYPAQHWPHKNHITLLKAVKYLKQRYNINIEVVLTGIKHTRLDNVYKYIEDNNLSNQVHFIGNIPFQELFYAYKKSLATVIPVVYESSSLPIKEAMALNVAVIASKNGANEEINTDNNILLFGTYDSKKLALQIKKVYENNKLKKQLIIRSRKVIQGYSWENIAKQYKLLFERIHKKG